MIEDKEVGKVTFTTLETFRDDKHKYIKEVVFKKKVRVKKMSIFSVISKINGVMSLAHYKNITAARKGFNERYKENAEEIILKQEVKVVEDITFIIEVRENKKTSVRRYKNIAEARKYFRKKAKVIQSVEWYRKQLNFVLNLWSSVMSNMEDKDYEIFESAKATIESNSELVKYSKEIKELSEEITLNHREYNFKVAVEDIRQSLHNANDYYKIEHLFVMLEELNKNPMKEKVMNLLIKENLKPIQLRKIKYYSLNLKGVYLYDIADIVACDNTEIEKRNGYVHWFAYYKGELAFFSRNVESNDITYSVLPINKEKKDEIVRALKALLEKDRIIL